LNAQRAWATELSPGRLVAELEADVCTQAIGCNYGFGLLEEEVPSLGPWMRLCLRKDDPEP